MRNRLYQVTEVISKLKVFEVEAKNVKEALEHVKNNRTDYFIQYEVSNYCRLCDTKRIKVELIGDLNEKNQENQ